MHRTIRRLGGVAFAAGLLALPSVPAGAADEALIAAAKKEGEVVWYTSFIENQLGRPLAAAFEKKYPGVKVSLVPGTATDLLLKLLGEARAGGVRADVHHGGSALGPLLKAEVVEKYVPDAAKDYPAELKDPQGYWTADALYFLVAAINTDLVPADKAPKSYQDLLAPQWKGKIAWTNQLTQGGAAGFIGTMLASQGEQAGMDYLKALAAQKLVNVPANQRVVLDQVIAGEYPLALATFNNHSTISAAKGAPVKWLRLEPVTGTLDTVMLLKGPHPNAGRLFIDFSLSLEGQKVLQDAGYLPAHPQVPAKDAELKPQEGKFKVQFLSPQYVDANLPKWVAVYNELFK